EGMDTGPVLGTLTETVRDTDTAGDLLGHLAEAGSTLLVATLDGIEDGSLTPIPQSREGISYAPKLTVEDARIDWSRPAYVVDRQVRGCTPAPGAWTTFRGERLKVQPVELLRPAADATATAQHAPTEPPDAPLRPGEIRVRRRDVLVGTGSGAVRLGTVQPHGKRAMAATDWARGARPEHGEVLGE